MAKHDLTFDPVTSVLWLTSMPVKTTTSERILFYTGLTHKIGEYTMVLLPWTGWRKNRSVYHYYLCCDHHILELCGS